MFFRMFCELSFFFAIFLIEYVFFQLWLGEFTGLDVVCDKPLLHGWPLPADTVFLVYQIHSRYTDLGRYGHPDRDRALKKPKYLDDIMSEEEAVSLISKSD